MLVDIVIITTSYICPTFVIVTVMVLGWVLVSSWWVLEAILILLLIPSIFFAQFT